MSFIAFLCAVLLLQYWGSAGRVHNDWLFEEYLQRLGKVPSEFRLAVAVLLPVIGLAWLLDAVQNGLFGLLWLALTVLVLLYSFGRGDFEEMVQRYRGFCLEGDFQAGYQYTRELLQSEDSAPESASAAELHLWVERRLLYLGYERWFAVVFYFALFGASGALAYRLLQLYRAQQDEPEKQQTVFLLVDWLPSRALGLAFGLTADFVASAETLTSSLSDFDRSADHVLFDTARAALGLANAQSAETGDNEALAQRSDWEIEQIQGLLRRSAVAWIAVISVMVLLI